jgi:uncharacterized paraquat-inducible protein A
MTTATQAFCERCGLYLSATKTAESTSSRRFEGLGRAHLIYMFFGDEWSLVNVLGYLSPEMS